MQKIKIIVDSPCDIPDEDLARYNIDMVGVPIVIDSEEFFERRSFSIREFYTRLEAARELPVTSRVPMMDYALLYQKAWEDGCTDVINITINAKGSGIFESARMAIDFFYSENPQARDKLRVHMVDSKTYSMAYGYPAIQAAIQARAGKTAEEIVAYLHDFFDRVEIYLACYTLDYAKRSGRITAAAAFVGDVLGLRPIISMIDGQTRTVEKVRGDKQVVSKLVELYRKQRPEPDSPVWVVSGSVDEYGAELQSLLGQELNREIPHYKAGASIVINAGPKMAAICMLGRKRSGQ